MKAAEGVAGLIRGPRRAACMTGNARLRDANLRPVANAHAK
jgi:hypothetical protein